MKGYLFRVANKKVKKRPTKRAPDAGDSAHIPSSFLHLIIFLAGRLRRPRPSAGNANRWVAEFTMTKTSKRFSAFSISWLLLITGIMSIMVGCASPTQTPTLPVPTKLIIQPTIESTVSPTQIPLSPTGSWLAFTADNYLFAVNKDGTGLTSLAPELSVMMFNRQPSSNTITAITSSEESQSLAITFIELPSKNIIHEIPLLSFYADGKIKLDIGSTGALGGIQGGIQWSPNGEYLAFMGAIENSQSSLYVYDSKLQVVKKLSENQYQAANPTWSPDGKWIIFEDVSDFLGWQTESVWATSVDDGKTKLLYKADQTEQRILGWVGHDNFVVTDHSMDGNRNIRMVNVVTGKINDLYSGYFTLAAVSKNGTVIFLPTSGAPGAGSTLESGFYLISPNTTSLKLIHKLHETENVVSLDIIWDSSNELFITGFRCDNEPEKAVAFDITGKEVCVTNLKSNFSPNGDWYIIIENGQLNIYKSDGNKLGEINENGRSIVWDPSSDGFFTVTNNKELNYVSLSSMNSQSVYKSRYGFFGFTWIGVP